MRNEKQLGKHRRQSWGNWGIMILPDFEAGDRGGNWGIVEGVLPDLLAASDIRGSIFGR